MGLFRNTLPSLLLMMRGRAGQFKRKSAVPAVLAGPELARRRWEVPDLEQGSAGPAEDPVPEIAAAPATRLSDGTNAAVQYEEALPGAPLFAELPGTARPGQQLGRAVAAVMAVLIGVAGQGVNGAGRLAEVVVGMAKNGAVSVALMADGWLQGTPAERVVAQGINQTLAEMREKNLQYTSAGRVAYNAIRGAAVSAIPHHPERGLYAGVADALGIPHQKIGAAIEINKRAHDAKVSENCVVMLDPSRKERSDTLPPTTVAAIQLFWAENTRPSPDMKPIAKLTLDNGDEIMHGVHWQEKGLADLYDEYCATENPTVGKEKFRQLKPYFVRDPTQQSCLCPDCTVMKNLLEPYRGLVAKAVSGTCECSFCTFHKGKAARAASAPAADQLRPPHPPTSPSKLVSALCCEKPLCPEGSGFSGERYPTHKIGCFRRFLVGKHAAFVDNDKNNPAELPSKPIECATCKPKFQLLPPAECQFLSSSDPDATVTYNHYVSVPRHSGSASDRETLRETTVTRPEFVKTFEEHFSKYLLHIYVCDWQDAIADEKIRREKKNHIVIGWDFAMNYTCIPKWEIKAQFFSREQISLHTTIAYHEWPPDFEKVCDPPLADGTLAERS